MPAAEPAVLWRTDSFDAECSGRLEHSAHGRLLQFEPICRVVFAAESGSVAYTAIARGWGRGGFPALVRRYCLESGLRGHQLEFWSEAGERLDPEDPDGLKSAIRIEELMQAQKTVVITVRTARGPRGWGETAVVHRLNVLGERLGGRR